MAAGRESASRGLLLGWLRRRWSWALRTARGALFANRRQFLLPLDVFVETDGQILDDRILHAETALDFVNQFAAVRADLEIDVDSFAMLGDAIGQLARAPVLGLFDLAALFRAGNFDGVLRFLDFLFRRCRTNDKNQVVQTIFHVSSFLPQRHKAAATKPMPFYVAASSPCWRSRRLYFVIAASIPFVRRSSTASPASLIISAATSSSAFFIGRRTYSLRLDSG